MNGTWSQVKLERQAVDLYQPPGADRSPFGLIYLHSAGGENLRGQAAFTKVFDALGLRCFCPHGDQSWWTDRLCPSYDPERSAEAYLLHVLLPFIEKEHSLTPPRIGLLGVSMGGQGALRLGFKHPQTFPAVAGISSALEYHQLLYQRTPLDQMYQSKEQCRQDTAAMHINPHTVPSTIFLACDPADAFWFRGNDRLHEKLGALGIAHECDLVTTRGGHCWEYFDLMAERAIRPVHAGLVHQSRRLM
jgi:S-formylglutathione hydrolase FrmB